MDTYEDLVGVRPAPRQQDAVAERLRRPRRRHAHPRRALRTFGHGRPDSVCSGWVGHPVTS